MTRINIARIFSINLILLLLVGCMENTTEKTTTEASGNNSNIEDTTEINASDSTSEEKETGTESENDSERTTTVDDKEDRGILSEFSSEQIEYARVWLQLGVNQDLDELYARYIPAGEPINPNDETSANYPENVIQLSGSRMIDGSVTYSGNGDGTINVYNVPLRWETNVPEGLDENYMKELTESIIENTELIYVDPGNEEDIITLIELLHIN
ncbi:hypothetical protein [Sutcliffiella rhizosphaerae]|uniref:Lipoprotein n=1 Tax=Sutcliffiella rhizosphaerae TaxID=2880967 RepID=A0ABM8YN79_9BACI|nr:hypothetical protein [Sutcliffiella rhizosphaerae]CAG9621318.1 hypothetical protein BACCIP111883_02090 [Sutcliffiella rhizosphaerae]